VIDRMPCTIRLLKTSSSTPQFHDFDAYASLGRAARELGWRTELIVLLGGDAGLRLGEILALERTDLDLQKRQICVARSTWKGITTLPKGGRIRYVPMTIRLAAALKVARHLRGRFVVCQDDGQALTMKMVQDAVKWSARRANVLPGVHILRHTFCSHLAMKGAPTRAIQELAGHKDLATTQRYMHLSPAAIEGAIRLLDQNRDTNSLGDMLETSSTEIANSIQ
jgi:integrase